jgi:hypothetical protein
MGRPKKTEKKNMRGNGEGTIYQRADKTWCAQITTGVDPLKGTPIRKTVYGKKREDVKNKLIEIQKESLGDSARRVGEKDDAVNEA